MISKFTFLAVFFLSINCFSQINPICNPPPEAKKQAYNTVPKATSEKPGLQANTINVPREILIQKDLLFFNNSGPFGSYFTLDIDFLSAQAVFEQIKNKGYTELKNRGEAHITILTPIEYFCIFGEENIYGSESVTMSKIQNVVQRFFRRNLKNKIQYEITGLGSGHKTIFDLSNNKFKVAETFFLITPSEDLVNIRREIRKLLKSPAAYNAFVPENFYPHITIGYTDSDLHESDGVRKNSEFSLDPRFPLAVR